MGSIAPSDMIGCEGSDLNRRTLAYEASEVTRLLNPAIEIKDVHFPSSSKDDVEPVVLSY